MFSDKHSETEKLEKKNEHHSESGASLISEEIFSTLEGYAIKGAEEEYIPDDKKEKPEILSDI